MSSLLLTIYYITAVGILILCTENIRFRGYRIAAKASASAGFVLLAARGLCEAGLWGRLMFPAFLLCMAGDVALAQAKRPKKVKWLVCVAVCFLLGHVIFIAAFSSRAPLNLKDLILPAAAFATVLWLSGTEWFQVPRMRGGIAVYAFFLTLLFVKGITMVMTDVRRPQNWLACAGSLLFLISDAILYVDWFGVMGKRGLKLWNLIFYYGGMLLLAYSAVG